MNVHFALVGGQPAPVYYGVLKLYPKGSSVRIVLICSQQSSEEGYRIKSILESDNYICEIIDNVSPYNLPQLRYLAQKLKKGLKEEDNLTLNLVGGTKAWSIVFYDEFCNRKNTNLFLVDQNNKLWNIATGEMISVDQRINTLKHLRLYNNVISFNSFKEYSDEDVSLARQIAGIWASNKTMFNSLTVMVNDAIEKKINNGSYVKIQRDNNSIERLSDKLVNLYFNKKNYKFESKNASKILFFTHWYEVEVTSVLLEWLIKREPELSPEKLKSRIFLNCVFPVRERKYKQDIKNEIDIIVNIGNKLVFVECKTSIFSSTNIDKFKNAVRNYGGTGTKSLYITSTPPSNQCKEKFKDSNISYSLLRADNPELDKDILFQQLDSYVDEINK